LKKKESKKALSTDSEVKIHAIDKQKRLRGPWANLVKRW
jgi:hypothetical protein